jgi:hypothetical protein
VRRHQALAVVDVSIADCTPSMTTGIPERQASAA